MTGYLPIRSLNSVMVATLHVAVVSYTLRSFLGPNGLTGPSVVLWVPLSILVSFCLSMPMGQAIAGAFGARNETSRNTCSRCRLGELRPLLRSGAGLFAPITGYRCAGCGTTFRQVGEWIVEEPASSRREPVNPEGVTILNATVELEPDDLGIRFLDEPPIGRRPANVEGRDVSGVEEISQG